MQCAFWVVILATGLAACRVAAETTQRCNTSERTPRLTEMDQDTSGSVVFEFDDSWHADIIEVANRYWTARLTKDIATIKTLLPPLPADELQAQLSYQRAMWESEGIAEYTLRALALQALDRRCRVVVYAEVSVATKPGECVSDLVTISFEFGDGWKLVPVSDTTGGMQIFNNR